MQPFTDIPGAITQTVCVKFTQESLECCAELYIVFFFAASTLNGHKT
jgi:hypothetical protein